MKFKNICSANKVRTILVCICMGIVLCSCVESTEIPGKKMPWGRKKHGVIEVTSDNVATKSDKVAFLTFDDGPSELTEKVLDILKENDVKATFFLIGNQINKDTKKIVKRMNEEGHQIGVHTYCHEPECIYSSADTYYSDVLKTEVIISKYTGVPAMIYRFPYGSVNGYIKGYRKKIINKLSKHGLEYCDWNVSGEDSVGNPTAKKIIKNIKKNYNVYDNPVILLHDSGSCKETVKALPEIIRMYKEDGYSFDVIKNRYRPVQWKSGK